MRLLAVLCVFLVTGPAWAQGNLQFNQIKLVSASENVPAGKVWKVESVIYSIAANVSGVTINTSNTTCADNTYRSRAIVIDGVTTKVQRSGGDTGAINWSSSERDYISFVTALPIWLPAGASLSGGPCNNKISVIEFNLVP